MPQRLCVAHASGWLPSRILARLASEADLPDDEMTIPARGFSRRCCDFLDILYTKAIKRRDDICGVLPARNNKHNFDNSVCLALLCLAFLCLARPFLACLPFLAYLPRPGWTSLRAPPSPPSLRGPSGTCSSFAADRTSDITYANAAEITAATANAEIQKGRPETCKGRKPMEKGKQPKPGFRLLLKESSRWRKAPGVGGAGRGWFERVAKRKQRQLQNQSTNAFSPPTLSRAGRTAKGK